jgi:cytochrome P450
VVGLSQIDLLDRDAFGRRVPHEWFEHLRRNAPIYRHPEPDGPGFWVLTRHEDVAELTRNWASFSSDQERGGVIGLEDRRRAGGYGASRGGRLMLTMDPPGAHPLPEAGEPGVHASVRSSAGGSPAGGQW